jgi:uncharacterized protein DUF4013
MSEAQALPPPPPPPPPPTGVPATPQFDFGKPFTYVFDDPRWINKILLGGLFYLAGFFIIGWFFILGYVAQVTRNVIADHERPLPEWDDLGNFLSEGARLIGVVLVYIIPVFMLVIAVMVPTGVLNSIENEGVQAVGGVMVGCLSCLFVPLSLAMLVFMPASLLFAIAEQRFSAAFEFGRIWNFITANVGNYLLAIVVYLIARFLSGFGIALLCIGVVFTGFWSFLITAHGFAQVYRLHGK